MKKEYFTPEIIFDSFALGENIANVNDGCNINLTTAYSGSCGLPFVGNVLFTITATGCKHPVQDGSNGICYHVPIEGQRLFNS